MGVHMFVVQGHRLVAEEGSMVVDHRSRRTVVEDNLVEDTPVDRRRRMGLVGQVAVAVADRVDLVVAELVVRKVVDHLV
jgi:hypothetical protein